MSERLFELRFTAQFSLKTYTLIQILTFLESINVDVSNATKWEKAIIDRNQLANSNSTSLLFIGTLYQIGDLYSKIEQAGGEITYANLYKTEEIK